MGTWNTSINGNDTFLDVYEAFFELYNQGYEPVDITKLVLKEYEELFNDNDDKNNALFGLALAQWETKVLDPEIFNQIKDIVQNSKDIAVWRNIGADEKTLKLRKGVLQKFLIRISTEREQPKRRIKPKFESSSIELVKIVAPDRKKTFEANEFYHNGVYEQTGSAISWSTGGGSLFYFTAQGKSITAQWLDSHTLEVTHDSDIVFTKKDDAANYIEDEVKVIYKQR